MTYYIQFHVGLFGLRSTDKHNNKTKAFTHHFMCEVRLARDSYRRSLHESGLLTRIDPIPYNDGQEELELDRTPLQDNEAMLVISHDARRGPPSLPRIVVVDGKGLKWEASSKLPTDIQKEINKLWSAHKLAMLVTKDIIRQRNLPDQFDKLKT